MQRVLGMERVETAYRAGVAEAESDIASGRPKLRYGARGAWGEDLARTLQTRFGVELDVLSCLVTAESSSFVAGYNATVEAHVDGVYGPGSVAAVWEEIQRRRQAAYDAWAAERQPADSGSVASTDSPAELAAAPLPATELS